MTTLTADERLHHVVLIDRPGLYAGLASLEPADRRRLHYKSLMTWLEADELQLDDPMPIWATVFGPEPETDGNTSEMRRHGYRYRSVPLGENLLDVMAQMIRDVMRDRTVGFITIITGHPNRLTERLDNFGRFAELEKRVIGLEAEGMRPRRGMYDFSSICELEGVLRPSKTTAVTNRTRRRSRRGTLRSSQLAATA